MEGERNQTFFLLKKRVNTLKNKAIKDIFVGFGLAFIFILFVILLVVLLALVPKIAQAEVEVLYPSEDIDLSTNWSTTPLFVDRYSTIDEEGTPNDADFIYMGTANTYYTIWKVQGGSNTAPIDSARFIGRCLVSGGSAGTSTIRLGRMIYDSEVHAWGPCGAGWDTITLTSTATNYTYNLGANDPCTGSAWDWADIYSNGSKAWGVQNLTIKTGIPAPQNRVTWYYIEVFYTPAAGGKRKVGGIVQDKDNKGIIEGGIGR
jgi:hypothetical protein